MTHKPSWECEARGFIPFVAKGVYLESRPIQHGRRVPKNPAAVIASTILFSLSGKLDYSFFEGGTHH